MDDARCSRCGMLPHAHVPIEFATDNDDVATLYVSPNLDGYCPPETGRPDGRFSLVAAPGLEGESEVVVLPRAALFEFFGEVALPPWQDAEGNWVGGDVDCAPLAERITEWVKGHEL